MSLISVSGEGVPTYRSVENGKTWYYQIHDGVRIDEVNYNDNNIGDDDNGRETMIKEFFEKRDKSRGSDKDDEAFQVIMDEWLDLLGVYVEHIDDEISRSLKGSGGDITTDVMRSNAMEMLHKRHEPASSSNDDGDDTK